MNIDRKMQGFKEIAMEEAALQKAAVIARVDEQFAKATAEYRIQAEKRYRKKVHDDTLAMERKKNRLLQDAAAKSKSEVTALRHKLLDEIAQNVTKRLLEYVKTEEYQQALLAEINETRWDKGADIIYLTARDLAYIKPRIKDGHISFEELDEACIGGYKMRFAQNMLLDCTYLTRFLDVIENVHVLR